MPDTGLDTIDTYSEACTPVDILNGLIVVANDLLTAADLVGVTAGVRVGVIVFVGVTDGVTVLVGVIVFVGVIDGVIVLVGVGVFLGVRVGVGVAVDVLVKDRVGVVVGVLV